MAPFSDMMNLMTPIWVAWNPTLWNFWARAQNWSPGLYVLLRQSLLAPHDKKKILLEHPGELKYEPVVKFFRLLGMFFLELQGSRQSAKTKVYDVNLSKQTEGIFCHQSDEHSTECACMALTEDVEPGPSLMPSSWKSCWLPKIRMSCLSAPLSRNLKTFFRTFLTCQCMMRWWRIPRHVPNCSRNVAAVASGQSSPVERTTVVLEKERAAARERGSETYFWLVLPDRPAACKRAIGKRNAPTGMKNWWWHRRGQHCWDVPAFLGPWSPLTEPEPAPSNADDVFHGVLSGFSVGISQGVPEFAEAFVVQALLNSSHKSQLGLKMQRVCQIKSKLPSRAFPMPRYAVDVKKSHRSDRSETECKPCETALPLPDVCHLASTGDQHCHAILDTRASKYVIDEKMWKQRF